MFENLECSQPVFYVFKYFLKITFVCNVLLSIILHIWTIFFKKNSQWKTSENNLKQLEYVIKKNTLFDKFSKYCFLSKNDQTCFKFGKEFPNRL